MDDLRNALFDLLEVTARLSCDDIRLYHLPVDTTKLTIARMRAMVALAATSTTEPVEFARNSETEIPDKGGK